MDYISSIENKLFKEVSSLKNKKYRYLNKTYLIEGIKFVEEAIQNGVNIKYIIICESKLKEIESKFDFNKLICKAVIFSDCLFNKIKQMETSQGIIAGVEIKENLNEINFKNGFYVLIDKIQDPGNLGTIIRTSVAANAKGIIIMKGTVDLYNEKVLRSTMGSIFKIDIYFKDSYDFINEFINNDFSIIVADSNSENIYFKEDLTVNMVLVVGNEGNGISNEIKSFNNVDVCIPMSNNLESLNVAQAMSIVVFERVRQEYIKNN